jgi:four helix bundle protein
MAQEGVERERDLRVRTKQFALMIVRLYSELPKATAVQVLGKQVLRSGTSVGAHYQEATRARSCAEFISKIEVGLQELEETNYWLELLEDSGLHCGDRLGAARREAGELVAMLTATVRTVKKNRTKTGGP